MFSFTSKKSKEEQVKMQQNKVALMAAENKKANFIGGEQFFQSLRDIGYRHEGQAICDIVDNSVEAGATKINIFTERGKQNRIHSIAIVDNGTGMTQEWLQNSIGFGGTSRENNPNGLGRYGMGLSSAGIAFSELLEVFSRPDQREYSRTYIDLRKDSPSYFDDNYLQTVLEYGPPVPQKMSLPEWLEKAMMEQNIASNFSGSGTIVVLSSFTPARRKWTFKDFKSNLERHMGVVYHKFAGDLEIFIDGDKLDFIDPLFLTPGLKGYDLDEDRAEEIGSESIIFKDGDGNPVGTLLARYCALPATFAIKSELKNQTGLMARVLAIQCDANISDCLKEAVQDYQPHPQLERKVLTKDLSNDLTISQLINEFKAHLKKLLNDILEFGYRTARSWRTEIASVLIAFNQSGNGSSKTYLAEVKNTFGEKIYKDAIKLAKSISSNQAQYWLSDFDLVIEICARAGMQTATVYKLAVAKL